MEATIVITTKNRKDDLRRALNSSLAQDIPCEVLVVDDASTDGTPAMVQHEFSTVRLLRSETSQGYIVQRNRAAVAASTNYIISIDDDAEFSSPSIVRQTLKEFDHPRIAAVAIPHKDILVSPHFKTPTAPDKGLWIIGAYVGTAHALRRDVFLKLGGYRESLVHNTEERDYGIRLLNFGYVIRIGRSDTILHYVSPVRDSWRGRMLERRNDIGHTLWNVPLPHLLYHLPGTIFSGLLFAIRTHCLSPTLAGYLNAVSLCLATWRQRDPVLADIYLLTRRLNRHKLLSFCEVEPLLGPIGSWQGRSPSIAPHSS